MMGIKRIGVMAAAVAASVATMSWAQASSAPGSRPTVTSPYWNDQPAGRNGSNVPNGVQTFDEPTKLLSQTVQAVPQAAADLVVAKWTYNRVNGDLNRVTNFVRDDFRASEEYADASAEMSAAYAEYDAARQEAVRGIQSSDGYRAAMQLRGSVNEQIANAAPADASEASQDDMARLAALASLKLDYITPLRTVERELIAASPRVAAARERLRKAARELERLEKTFARDVRDSIELSDLRKNRENARIAYLASWTYLQEARLARGIAYDYAVRSKVLDRYTPRLGGYGGYGGYGYNGIGGIGYPGIGVGYGGFGSYRGSVFGGIVE
jgi:hypothetical protein